VPSTLQQISLGQTPEVSDRTQRVGDLRAAGFVEKGRGEPRLTDFGAAVLEQWRRWNLHEDRSRELERVIIVYAIARRDGADPYTNFWAYWQELRSVFDPVKLIHNWDSLLTLNYLDLRRDGFAPADAYRDMRTDISSITYDLDTLVKDLGAGELVELGAKKVKNQLTSQIARARARPRSCLAMELMLRSEAERPAILAALGEPGRVREWRPLNPERVADVLRIVHSFDDGSAGQAIDAEAVVEFDDDVLANANREIPVRRRSRTAAFRSTPRKVDHQRRQERNSAVGRLGESFALAYEKHRLAGHPELQRRVQQVSLTDDTAGYDVHSFNVDGSVRLVEVKTTEGPLATRFFMSANERNCADKNPDAYVILRVGNIRTRPICCELPHPFTGVSFRASVFQCAFDVREADEEQASDG
jgi:hypothetical protein